MGEIRRWWSELWAEKGRRLYAIDPETGEVSTYHDLTPRQFRVFVGMIVVMVVPAAALAVWLGWLAGDWLKVALKTPGGLL
jgi:hypothetical protein